MSASSTFLTDDTPWKICVWNTGIWIGAWGLVIMLGADPLHATEIAPIPEQNQRLDQPGRTLMMNQGGPKRHESAISGVITLYDEVIGRLTVRNSNGTVLAFMLDTNTSAVDHHRQIRLSELRVGDSITIYYDTDPGLVNRIERN